MRTLEQIAEEKIEAKRQYEALRTMPYYGIGNPNQAQLEIDYARAKARWLMLEEEFRTRIEQESKPTSSA